MKDKELRKELKNAGVIDDVEYAFAHSARHIMESGVSKYWKESVDCDIEDCLNRIFQLEQKLSAVMELLNITEEDKKRVLKKGTKEVELVKK